ncbi:MAG: molybdopterin cofactor-binding domain-containing protein, partial [Rhodospirillaceae bacterium]
MNETHGANLSYVSRKRRVREDKRFVTGTATYVQDVQLPNMKHVALVQSPYAKAKIISIDASEALAMDGVHAVLTGEELTANTNAIGLGLILPEVKWYPLAVGMVRYVGEWVCAVVADDLYTAEDAAELVMVDYEPLDPLIDTEAAYTDTERLVHPGHGSNVLFDGHYNWGSVDDDFAAAEETLSFRVHWGRSSTVPIETFGVTANWDMATDVLDVWASIQMPNYVETLSAALRMPLNNLRLHQHVDVGGSYGVKRGIKHSVLVGYLSR